MVKTVRLPRAPVPPSRPPARRPRSSPRVQPRTSRLPPTAATLLRQLRRMKICAPQVLLVRGEGDAEGAPGTWETCDQPDEAPTDLPLAGGALAKVKTDAVGVCGTDFHAFYGKQVREASPWSPTGLAAAAARQSGAARRAAPRRKS